MSLKVALQMDDIASINTDSDTTFVLGLEAQNRGHQLYYYQPDKLSLINGEVIAKAHKITLQASRDNYFQLEEAELTELKTMDVVLMRQDPPYDMNYLTYTYMLDKIHPKTLVVNNPTEVRNCPEKLFVTDFLEFMPPTLISGDVEAIKDFAAEHGTIILKPLYAHGGLDVFKVDKNVHKVAKNLLNKYQTPIIAQGFIEGVKKGDKRIILIDGDFVGAVNRVPEENSILSNFVQGGTGEQTHLTPREIQICDALKPALKSRGLILTGIDVIDGYLTEINVTSPTGIQSINKLNNVKLEAMFWDAIDCILA